MTKNVGGIDKIIRIVLGLALIAATLMGALPCGGWIGIVPLATGLMGWCRPTPFWASTPARPRTDQEKLITHPHRPQVGNNGRSHAHAVPLRFGAATTFIGPGPPGWAHHPAAHGHTGTRVMHAVVGNGGPVLFAAKRSASISACPNGVSADHHKPRHLAAHRVHIAGGEGQQAPHPASAHLCRPSGDRSHVDGLEVVNVQHDDRQGRL